jgi:hypothetical protein
LVQDSILVSSFDPTSTTSAILKSTYCCSYFSEEVFMVLVWLKEDNAKKTKGHCYCFLSMREERRGLVGMLPLLL